MTFPDIYNYNRIFSKVKKNLKNFLTFPDLLQFVNISALVKEWRIWYIYYMKDLWNYLKCENKPIVLYGMGNGADKVISVCEKYGVKISGVFSSDGFVRSKTFHGMPVTDYKTAKDTFGEMVVLLCFGTALPDVIGNIKKISGECELYAPDVPVYGDTLFCAEYYEKHIEEFKEIFSLLADETSKNTLKSIIDYKLSGRIDYLSCCQMPEDEAYSSFLNLTDSETYLDLGAYRGDTVQSFCSVVKDYKEIIAVEPDKKTYLKLCENTKDIKNIRNINAFISDSQGNATFNSNGSRGTGAKGKETAVDVISVDSLALKPTFIKMDIEGAEGKAIKGATETIKRYKPKMQIAAYHKSGDLIDIPKAILSLRNDYKVYLRHNPCLPAWDVNYFFV